MTAKAAQQTTVSTILIGRWEQAARKLATLAEAFPPDKLESTPVKGTRTVGDVLRHVAFWNRYVADSASGRKADDSANELPKAEYSTKAQVLKALQQSAANATAALRTHPGELPPATAEMVMSFIEHTSEHYGQLVAYARNQGIVPPASR